MSRSTTLATAAAWRHEPPVQERARLTLDAFARAAETLLRDQPFESLSVRDIARRARRPIGSFYARFPTKEALLPYLYLRYHEGLEGYLAGRYAGVAWERLDFGRTVESVVDVTLGSYEERLWLIRAMALYARTRPETLPADVVERRRRNYEQAVTVLMRHRDRIAHDQPEEAIRFGMLMVSSVAREKLLFAQSPHSRVTPMTRATLRAHLIRALHTYLGARAPAPTRRRAGAPRRRVRSRGDSA